MAPQERPPPDPRCPPMPTPDDRRQGPLKPTADNDTVVVHNPPAAPLHMNPEEADTSGIRLLDAAAKARRNADPKASG